MLKVKITKKTKKKKQNKNKMSKDLGTLLDSCSWDDIDNLYVCMYIYSVHIIKLQCVYIK